MYKFLLSAITLLLISKIYSQPVSLTIPSGHAKAIEKIAVSSNGKYVASIAYKTVIVWDMASRKKIHEVNLDISLTASEASTLSITANADKLVASTNSGLFCYDIATGKQLFKNGSATSGAAFSADGSKVYAIDYGTLYIYKATDGNTIKYISGVVKNTSEDCIFFELGTNRLLILHHNGWSIVNTETDEIVVNNTFKDIYREKLSSYAYIQSKGIIAGIREDSLLLFDAFKTSVIKAKKLAGEPDGICVTDKGDIVTFRQDYKAGMFKTEIYDGGSLSVTHTSSQPQSDVPEAIFYGNNCIQLPGKDKIVFNNNLQLWAYDIENASYTNLFQNKITDFKAFYYYKNLSQRIAADNSLVFSTEDNGIRSFSMKTFSPDSFVAASPHIIYSSDGILAAGIDKKITITNRQTGKVVKTISLPAGVDHETEFFFFSYDNKKIIYTNREKGLLNALDINTGIPGSILSVGGSFYECSSSFDGKYFACKAGSSLKIFNLQTKQSVFNKKACDPANPDECINDFKFLNDSYYLFVEKNKDNVSIYKADDATYNSSFKIQHYNKFSVLGGDIKNNIIAIGEVGQFQVGTYNLKLITKEGKLIREFLSENNNDFLKAAFSNDDKIMFTPTTQKGVQVWDTETGELLGTYYFVEKTNEYIFVSPEGLFDGSVEGMKELYFVKNNQPIPLEKLYEQFYVPGLLQRKIHGEKFLPPDVASLHAPPKVVISYAEKQRNLELDNDVPSYQNTTGLAEITVTASTEDDAIDEIRLFLNGKVLNLATRNLIVEDDKSKTATKKYSVSLLPGVNEIRAVALNTQRTESKPDIINVVYNNGAANTNVTPVVNNNKNIIIDKVDQNATMHLVVVGINAYKNPKMNLNYALADATAFKDEVEKDAKTVISHVQTYFVTDDAANKDGIINAMQQVQQNAKPQDVFVFYYAGHGVVAGNKEFYLVPNDVTELSNVDEALKEHGIAAKDLQQYAINIQAQKQLFILDACQSAAAFADMLSSDGNQQKNIALVARSTGTHWMAASGAQQFANEFSTLGHGAFTYVLLQALKGEAANNKMITVEGLKDYMQSGVPALMKKYNGSQQTPASYGFGNDFPVEVIK